MTDQRTCKGCDQFFTPARKNQLYCNRGCQKNATRDSRTTENRRRIAIHYARTRDLYYMIYNVAPNQRLGVMKEILDYMPHDAGLRNILSDPNLLRENPRADGRKNIAQAASAYTKKFFGVSITTYIKQVKAGTVNEDFPVQRSIPERKPWEHVMTGKYVRNDGTAFLAIRRNRDGSARSARRDTSVAEETDMGANINAPIG